MPHKLEQQVALMDAYPEAGFLYGLSEYWYDWDKNHKPEQANEIPPLAPGNRLYHPPELLSANYPLGDQGAPCPSSFFLRRQAFDEVGGFEECFNPKTYQLYEDQAFLAKIYLNVPVFVADVCWDRYRCHPDSMGKKLEGTIREEAERRYYFRWLERYLRQQGSRIRRYGRLFESKPGLIGFRCPFEPLDSYAVSDSKSHRNSVCTTYISAVQPIDFWHGSKWAQGRSRDYEAGCANAATRRIKERKRAS